MPYRSLQRVLGETTLERKCLIFFGTSLFLLIIGSFWWGGQATTRLVYENTRSNCRVLAETGLLKVHALWYSGQSEHRQLLENMTSDLQHLSYAWQCLSLDTEPQPLTDSYMAIPDADERQILARLRERYLQRLKARASSPAAEPSPDPASEEEAPKVYETYVDEAPIDADRNLLSAERYDYYQVASFDRQCLGCHIATQGLELDLAMPSAHLLEDPAFFRVVKVSLPFRVTQRALNRIYAVVLALGIVTVFLAMLALYGIVRFLIVRPVQHLRMISEEVERGNYDARADIETHDEFEDLASSFNGMLRHLVDAQTKLQIANTELDAKVDQLAQANMQLYDMNRLKSDFLANVSHELRTPLNSIIGFSDVLKDIASMDEKQKRYVMNIRNSGRMLLEMINDILDLAKMESGKTELRPSEFQVMSLVQAQCDFQRAVADEKNIDISVDCPSALPPLLQDMAKLGQIIGNLVSNAIKFTPDGGSVRIAVRTEPDDATIHEVQPQYLRLSVIDTGVGIAKEDQATIFEKFRQARTVRGDNLTREYSGTGLGLSIVQELCKLLRGGVTLKSELGRGSEFTIRVPWQLSAERMAVLDVELADTRDLARKQSVASS